MLTLLTITVMCVINFQQVESMCSIFTIRKRSCKKVMFSQACVKNSVHGRGVHPTWADTSSQANNPLRQTHPQADTPRADTHLLGRHPLGRHNPWADTPLHQMVTAADGIHPTGMHSCAV